MEFRDFLTEARKKKVRNTDIDFKAESKGTINGEDVLFYTVFRNTDVELDVQVAQGRKSKFYLVDKDGEIIVQRNPMSKDGWAYYVADYLNGDL